MNVINALCKFTHICLLCLRSLIHVKPCRVLCEQVQKKNFVENVIPMVIALKNMLEEHRSPVLKHLMAYLQV